MLFIGSGGECKWQPEWSEIFPHIAGPDAKPAERDKAAAFIREQGERIKCGMLKLNPGACHKCSDNPQGKTQQQIDAGALVLHRGNIRRVERLYDAAQFGSLDLSQLPVSDFEMLRIWHWKIEEIRAKGRVF